MKQNQTKRTIAVLCLAMMLVGIASTPMIANAVSKNEQLVHLRQALVCGYQDVKYDINADGVIDVRDLVNLKKTIVGLTSDDYSAEDEDTFAGGGIK